MTTRHATLSTAVLALVVLASCRSVTTPVDVSGKPCHSHADCGGVALYEAEDNVGLSTTAYADDFASLPAQGVMGMDNCDESQRQLG